MADSRKPISTVAAINTKRETLLTTLETIYMPSPYKTAQIKHNIKGTKPNYPLTWPI
jgi:hypothetical protein